VAAGRTGSVADFELASSAAAGVAAGVSSEAGFDGPVVGLDRRSFFAQPDPLKWNVGAANALRMGPEPHVGHAVGPLSSTP
jgi:hypothetical protein